MSKPEHGHAWPHQTPTYSTWRLMKQRCLNPGASGYRDYGGRGIKVDPRWVESFQAFLDDMGERPLGTSIERKDSDGDYTPNNCRWATQAEQSRNTSRNVRLTYDGITLCMYDWAVRVGIPYGALKSRLRYGWSVEDALTRPVSSPVRGLGGKFRTPR